MLKMKTVLIIIYVIVAVVLTILTLAQTKDEQGASETITGGSFYEKNKGRTSEGKLKRATIILGILFIILAIILGIIY